MLSARMPATTNMMERINLELKKRTKKTGAFPNDASLLGLTVLLLMDIDEEWITGRRYVNMEAMAERREGYTVWRKLQKIMYTVSCTLSALDMQSQGNLAIQRVFNLDNDSICHDKTRFC